MNISFLATFFTLSVAVQGRTYGELGFVKIVKEAVKLQRDLLKLCWDVPYGTEEVYSPNGYTLNVPIEGETKNVEVKVMNLVLSVSVARGSRILHVVRVLPSVVDLYEGYWEFNDDKLQVIVPYKKATKIVPVTCNECLSRMVVLEQFPMTPKMSAGLGDGDDGSCYI
ncbi:uncharacterized protein LOC106132977 [Amyelois transitella]|uniref:uncharacterized protein LOC106132977 n=1 Tax=Amyelois transitella TaxID=680683 RepID=UPI00067E0F81|nr:uncharacterized protein LOC106132977 [Amyelois transitella]